MYDSGVQQRLREDVLEYCPLGKEILAQGTNTEADYFVVPETLHFDLPSK
jgi:Asp-tRNA(Asn)/Glu-tRNA(Gln) amidotransferase C subunit